MVKAFTEILRDFATDGVPSSGPHQPIKADFREALTAIEAFSNASGAALVYQSRALLFADLAHAANTMAWVVNDATTAYNGVYEKSGASGAGSWTRVADLPYSFIVATNSGTGTANAIQATTAIPVTSSSLVILPIVATASSAPITVSFNGGAVLTIVTSFGINAVSLPANYFALGFVSGSNFRLFSDEAIASLIYAARDEAVAANASAQAAKTAAETAQALTEAAAASVSAITYSDFYVDPSGGTVDFVTIAGGYTPGTVLHVYMNGILVQGWSATNGTTVTGLAITIADLAPGDSTVWVRVGIGEAVAGTDLLDSRYHRKNNSLISPFDYGGLGRGNPADNDTPAIIAAMNAALALDNGIATVDMTGGAWVVKDGLWPGHTSAEDRYMILGPDDKEIAFVGENWKMLNAAVDKTEYFTMFRPGVGGKIILRGGEFDHIYLPWTQAVCTSKTATTARFSIDTATCGTPQWNTIVRLYQYDPIQKTHLKTVLEQGLERPFTVVSTGVYDIDFSSTSETAALANVVVGGTYVIYHNVNGYYVTDARYGSIDVDNCAVRAVSGMAFSGSFVKDVRLTNFEIAPKTGSNRIISTTSDGAHFNGVEGDFLFRPNLISGTSDDWINVNVPASNVNNANPGAPYNTIIHNTFLIDNNVGLVPPPATPSIGDQIIAVDDIGAHRLLGRVTATSTVAPASTTFPAVTLDTELPVDFDTDWKIMNERFICSPIVEVGRVQNIARGGVVRGIAPKITGDFQDTNGGAVSIVAFWALYNEGPVTQEPIIDVTGRRCGQNPDSVFAAVELYATTILSPYPTAIAGVNIGGRIKAHMRDCRNRAVHVSSFDSLYVELSALGCNYDPWLSMPNPDAEFYAEKCNNIIVRHVHLGSTTGKSVYKTCVNRVVESIGNVTVVDVA